MADHEKTAVLLLAHGSPDSAEEVPEFLLKITGGRPLPPHVVEEVKQRYRLIGSSPLTKITLKQAEALAQELTLPVYVGMRNWKPFTAEAVSHMKADGIARAVVICMAPQNSQTSVGLYRKALNSSAPLPFGIDFVDDWHDHPLLVNAFAERLLVGWRAACREAKVTVPVIFTAHSVPQPTIAQGDPYEEQAKQTASLVARAAALEPRLWKFAFQSQGMSGGSWLGPTVEATILSLKDEGHGGVFVQPIGFVCDHVEVLYDIDIGFRQFAQKQDMRLWRAESLNDSPVLTSALADIARSRLAQCQNPANAAGQAI